MAENSQPWTDIALLHIRIGPHTQNSIKKMVPAYVTSAAVVAGCRHQQPWQAQGPQADREEAAGVLAGLMTIDEPHTCMLAAACPPPSFSRCLHTHPTAAPARRHVRHSAVGLKHTALHAWIMFYSMCRHWKQGLQHPLFVLPSHWVQLSQHSPHAQAATSYPGLLTLST